MSSKGTGIHVHDKTPLHLSFNEENNRKMEIKADFRMSRYQNYEKKFPVLSYTICVADDIKTVWLTMFKEFYHPPTAIPDEVMLMYPVWSTWARYKVNVNEKKVLQYADEIKKFGFTNSQIEIDDMYTTHYGEFNFDTKKFPNAKRMINKLHSMGFRVTCWVHPFVNPDSPCFAEGAKHGFFVRQNNDSEPAIIKWWQGNGAIIDVTNEAACDWYTRRLKSFQKEYNIDSFKFDAGEVNWLPHNMSTFLPMMNPCDFATKYVEMISSFGSMIETRIGYHSQR